MTLKRPTAEEYAKNRYPKPNNELEWKMDIAKEMVEAALALRKEAGIPLRHPVSEIIICIKD